MATANGVGGCKEKGISCWPSRTYARVYIYICVCIYYIYFIMENPICSQAKCPSRITHPEQRISLCEYIPIYMYILYIYI